jgi:hypothetical protein
LINDFEVSVKFGVCEGKKGDVKNVKCAGVQDFEPGRGKMGNFTSLKDDLIF